MRVDGDVGGAVAALTESLERLDPDRAAGPALDDRPPPLPEEAGHMCVQFRPHAVGESIGGVDEDEVEAGRLGLLGPPGEPATGVGADQFGALAEAEALDVAERRASVAVDEDGLGGAP